MAKKEGQCLPAAAAPVAISFVGGERRKMIPPPPPPSSSPALFAPSSSFENVRQEKRVTARGRGKKNRWRFASFAKQDNDDITKAKKSLLDLPLDQKDS